MVFRFTHSVQFLATIRETCATHLLRILFGCRGSRPSWWGSDKRASRHQCCSCTQGKGGEEWIPRCRKKAASISFSFPQSDLASISFLHSAPGPHESLTEQGSERHPDLLLASPTKPLLHLQMALSPDTWHSVFGPHSLSWQGSNLGRKRQGGQVVVVVKTTPPLLPLPFSLTCIPRRGLWRFRRIPWGRCTRSRRRRRPSSGGSRTGLSGLHNN